jgi:hypothetical protein
MDEEGDYLELKTFLSEISTATATSVDEGIGNDYNHLVQKLSVAHGLNADEYLAERIISNGHRVGSNAEHAFYRIAEIRTRGARLAHRVNHIADYEPNVNLPTPSSSSVGGAPLVSVSAEANNNLSITNVTLIEFTTLINRAEATVEAGSKEATFLEKMKDGLGQIKDISNLIGLILQSAIACGLDIQNVAKLLKLN